MRSGVQVVGILSVVMVKPVLHIYLYRSALQEGQCTGQDVRDPVKQVELSHAASPQGLHIDIESFSQFYHLLTHPFQLNFNLLQTFCISVAICLHLTPTRLFAPPDPIICS